MASLKAMETVQHHDVKEVDDSCLHERISSRSENLVNSGAGTYFGIDDIAPPMPHQSTKVSPLALSDKSEE